jgi:hypothetical protein
LKKSDYGYDAHVSQESDDQGNSQAGERFHHVRFIRFKRARRRQRENQGKDPTGDQGYGLFPERRFAAVSPPEEF